MFIKKILVAFCLVLTTGFVQAAIIPTGPQTNVSQATVDSWGWTECHRSATNFGSASTASVDNNCTGDYIMMGAWDASINAYGIIGIGEADVVTTYTHVDFRSDDSDPSLDNWSNGLNWYRTEGRGSWGFTTSNETRLSSADICLASHLCGPAIGLSFHTNANGGGDFSTGWAYNPTGTGSHSFLYSTGDQRVFWTANASVPTPASFALFGLGLMMLCIRRKKN